jgi:hypothetical protein
MMLSKERMKTNQNPRAVMDGRVLVSKFGGWSGLVAFGQSAGFGSLCAVVKRFNNMNADIYLCN